MGKERKKAKESRVVPHPKLNPGCATAKDSSVMNDWKLNTTPNESWLAKCESAKTDNV